MSDRRNHRGAAPRDREFFSPASLGQMRRAAGDLTWLADGGYTDGAALKLIGDHFRLNARQRHALRRAVCSTEALQARSSRLLEVAVRVDDETGATGATGSVSCVPTLHIDGFNVITTLEAALSGAIVLHCRDGCYRDIQGVHGSYRKVEETVPALRILRDELELLGCTEPHWYLDQPVSNSGRLKMLIEREMSGGTSVDATRNSVPRRPGVGPEVHVIPDPDPVLKSLDAPLATADSVILDVCSSWVNLARRAIERAVPEAWIVRLDDEGTWLSR